MDADPAGADPGLTAEGHTQARALAAMFATGVLGPVDALVSSTMQRARQTAAALADSLGLPVVTGERIVELDHGWPTYGVDFDWYPSRAAGWSALNSGSWGEHHYDLTAFVRRVHEGIEEHVARTPEGVLGVVCHGGVISAYLSQVIGSAAPMFVDPGYTSFSRVLAQPDGSREVISINEAPHLIGAAG